MKTNKKSWMFVGEQPVKTEEAIKRYTSLFPKSKVIDIEHFQPGEHEPEGSVKIAHFTINSTEFMAMDSHLDHGFDLMPSMSLYVQCDTQHEIKKVCHALSGGGPELMPLDDSGFSQKYGWLNDK